MVNMRNFKFYYVVILVFVFIVCIFSNYYVSFKYNKRYHQHIEDNFNYECPDDEVFCTHLPIVSISTNDLVIPDGVFAGDKINASITIYDKTKEVNKITDSPISKNNILIGYRGNSSIDFDKHQYSIQFINDKGLYQDVSVLGMDSDNHWILNGPFLDKTQIRNYVAYNISGEIMGKVPDVRFCEVFLNDEYQGLYVMTESISRNLTGITNYKPRWSNGLTSYIIRADRYDENSVMLNNFGLYTGSIIKGNGINVIYPSEAELDSGLVETIEEDFSRFEHSLYSFDYKEYSKYIDVDSFVDYMIINEYFRNADAGTHSTYLYKDVRGKITMGPVWDFNNSVDNYFEEVYPTSGFIFQEKTWYEMLVRDPKFIEKVIKRYRELRKTILNNDYIQGYIDDVLLYIKPAVVRNFEVWGYTFGENFVELKPIERNYRSYEDAVFQYKNYLEERGKWLDNNIDSLYQYSHFSVNKKYNME